MKPKAFKTIVALAFFCGLMLSTNLENSYAQSEIQWSGYVKELAALSFPNSLNSADYDNIIHHRSELSWELSSEISLQLDGRFRLIQGSAVSNTPSYGDYLDQDDQWLDLSYLPYETNTSILHIMADRAQINYQGDTFEITAGRQRLNWGKSMVWNPNDLFNTYAFLDFDYEERPGTDAINSTLNWGISSGIDLAWHPGSAYHETVAAIRYRTAIETYDLQLLTGYYQKQFATGFGWSGYVADAGFYGETTLFIDTKSRTVSSTSFGFSYMTDNEYVVQLELLYNGGFRDGKMQNLTEPPSADNLYPSEKAVYATTSKQVHPLVTLQGATIVSIDRTMVVFMPQTAISLSDNLDLLIIVQSFQGGMFKTTNQNSGFIRLKYSF